MSFPLEVFVSRAGDEVGDGIKEWVQRIHERCVLELFKILFCCHWS
jgi:hypothetical protein